MRVRATVLVLVAGLGMAAPARAATFTVTAPADSTTGTCDGASCTTLRAALAEASKASGPDVIRLPAQARGNYRVTAGQLSVDSEVAITGDSAATVTVQGDGKSSRIFNIATTAKVTIAHLTIANGAATATDDGTGGDILVGQGANLTLDHVRVTGGYALRGGGIGMRPASTLTIAQSLVDHNTATSVAGAVSGDAGALLSTGNGKLAANVLRISDSTIAQNSAFQGAGIELQSNAANQTTLDRVTIALNSGSTNALGNGVSVGDAESVKVASSIIAGNTGDGVPTNCDAKLTSIGGNVDTGTSCGFGAPADKPGTDPQLSTVLGTAGGETLVLPIPATSPAVDFAPACSAYDQRDLTRPQGKSCDAGAYEVDQAPQTAITDGPSGLVNSTNATFTFTASDPGSTFQCSRDGGAAATCSSPQTYNGLAQGAHTFSVWATDPGANSDPTPATASWTVDTVAPDTSITGTPPTRVKSAISFSFSSNDGSATFRCRLDTPAGAGTYSACTSPLAYSGLAEGNHRFHVVAGDPAGNTDPTEATWDFQVDATPPNTTLTAIPSPTSDSTPSFSFTSSESGSTFECRVDTASFAGCSTPSTTAALSDGSHTFSVRAIDAAGNVDASPASQTFVVDTAAPAAPAITTPPANVLQASATVNLGGSAEANATVRVFDGTGTTPVGTATASGTGAWTLSLTGVADGAHPYTAKALDAAGNVSPASAQRTVTVDTTPPAKPAITAPADNAWFNTATPTLSGSAEPNATVKVLEGTTVRGTGAANGNGGWSIKLGGVADGNHTYTVTATDAAQNVSTPSDPKPIRVDTVAPAAGFQTTPPAVTSGAIAFALSSTEGGVSFTCQLIGPSPAGPGACTSGPSYSGLAEGAYRFLASATDPAGNQSAAIEWDFTVDKTAPAAPAITSPVDDSAQNSRTVVVSGTGDPGLTITVLDGGTTVATTTVAAGGGWTTTLTDVAEGRHTYTAVAKDAAGNVSGASNARAVTVDLTPPPADVTGGPAGVTTDPAPAFSFASPDSSVQFLCRLDGPGGAGAEQVCTSPHGFGTLAPGGYTFFVTAVDPAGNRTTTSRSFTVAAPPQQVAPAASPTPTPTPPPEPVFHQSVVVQPAGGTVLVRRKGSKTFVALAATQGIPLGSEVDTKHGKVELSSVPKRGGAPQTALFYGGIFVVTQTGATTQLALSERLAGCAAAKAAAAAAGKKKPKTRNLWGDGHGSFRTKGQYSAATVRGTRWNVRDSCAGTLTRVARGVVAVNDLVTHKTKVLRAGQRYLAKPKRRR